MVKNFLPGLNLLNQILKQISKPVSFRIVKYARTRPVFRRYFLILPGRRFHILDQRVRRRITGTKDSEKLIKKQQVDEKTAIEAGANLMSECIIFVIAGLGVTAEVYRNARNAAAKETVKKEQMKKLIEKKEALLKTVEKHDAVIRKLEKIVNEYIRLAPTTSAPPENKEKYNDSVTDKFDE